MRKLITRWNKFIRAEIYDANGTVDTKDFNLFRGLILSRDPTQKHYDMANAWADKQIELYSKNTKTNA